ncbi:MAG: 4Fe-4S binding protein, partial [Elusimicrobiota bacterium]
VTTVISLILSFFIHQRTWCFVCPVGTIASGAGAKKYKIKLESEKCTLCGACARVCPAQIIPYSYKDEGTVRIENRDCIKCGLCVSACPEQALKKPE